MLYCVLCLHSTIHTRVATVDLMWSSESSARLCAWTRAADACPLRNLLRNFGFLGSLEPASLGAAKNYKSGTSSVLGHDATVYRHSILRDSDWDIMRQASNGHAKSNGAIQSAEQTGAEVAGTDHTRWRMKDDRGTQTWHYLESDEEVKAWPQSTADKWYLGMDTVRPARVPTSRLRN